MRFVASFNQLVEPKSRIPRIGVTNLFGFFEPKRTRVRGSSYLQSMGIDNDTGRLEVEFTDGAIYQYDCNGNEQKVMDDILAAPSRGSYFYHHVRTDYPFYQVKPRDKTKKRGRNGIWDKIYDLLGW